VMVACMMLFSFSSCNNYLDDNEIHYAASEEQQWNNLADVRSALMGVYGLMRAALAENDTHWICGDLRYGDFKSYNRSDLQAVMDNKLNGNYDLLNDLSSWRRFYAVINAAAVFIEKAPQVVDEDPKYSDVNLDYDIAQARAIRAFAYFYMVRIWGDVPLITQSYDNGSFPKIAQSPAETVLNYCKNELLAVVNNLPFLYGVSPSTYYDYNYDYWEGELFNKLTAYAVLAHIAAWKGNYADVDAYTSYILDNLKEIIASYSDVDYLTSKTGLFKEKNGSKILGFSFDNDYQETSQTGHIEDLTLAYPFVQQVFPEIYVSKDSIYSIFNDLSDLRFGIDTTTMDYETNYFYNMNTPVPVFSKIKVVKDGVSDGDYAVFGSSIIFTRPEEIALLRAEALVVLNRPDEALALLNAFRETRGLVILRFSEDLDGDNKKLLKNIFEERRRELMGEGWRWYDQIRYQRLVGDNPEIVALINSDGGIYWPVAKSVLQANPLLKQNSYWK